MPLSLVDALEWLSLPVCLVLWILFQRDSRLARPPPGPRGLPLLGVTLDMLDQSVRPWRRFETWTKQFGAGPLLHVPTLQQHHIIVNSLPAALTLLEKRASIYSNRPPSVFTAELTQKNMVLANIRNDDDAVMRRRKLLSEQFNPAAATQCQRIQTDEARRLVLFLLESPTEYVQALKRVSNSLVLRLVYSKAITMPEEALWDHVEHTLNRSEPVISHLLNIWPWLKYWPLWLPGGSFKRSAEAYYQKDCEIWLKIFEDVEANIKRGMVESSILSRMIETKAGDRHGLSRLEMAFAASNLLVAGGDLAEITIKIFILAMLHFPDVLSKCHKEIDRVVGRDRLPEFADKAKSPYLRATILETQRWRTLTPIGVAHAVTQDDYFEGMLIPKNSIIYPNIWAMSRDESLYPEPEVFRPERFLTDDGSSFTRRLGLPTFGFGKRMCAAMHVAEATLFITIAHLVWAFDWDIEGAALPSIDISDWEGLLPIQPRAFPCRMRPRGSELSVLLAAHICDHSAG